jgi:hypothetical protein
MRFCSELISGLKLTASPLVRVLFILLNMSPNSLAELISTGRKSKPRIGASCSASFHGACQLCRVAVCGCHSTATLETLAERKSEEFFVHDLSPVFALPALCSLLPAICSPCLPSTGRSAEWLG